MGNAHSSFLKRRSMKKQNVAEAVALLLRETVEAEGCTLWDVEYRKEGADYHLEITIDKPEGVTIEDCERVHRAIDPILDLADPIEESYILDVSSPGIERVLRTEEHLAFAVGTKVEIRLFAAQNGKKSDTGILQSFTGEKLTLTDGEGKETVYDRDGISKISTVYFD